MKKLMLVISVVLLSGCATTKHVTPMSSGGSKADGIVRMTYDFGAFEKVVVNTSAGLDSAIKRCNRWGYSNAEAFDMGSKKCFRFGTGLFEGQCMQGQVTTEYQCLD